MKNKKVAIIGLDCATPQLVFDQWLPHLPNIKRLVDGGVYGELESIIPPITVPAWTCMMTGKDPGELGIYGFRNRKDHTYHGLSYATSLDIKADTVWDIIAKGHKKSILVGVPQTYPPRPIDGCMITCFLTPSTESQYTYPESLKHELEKAVGRYILDVAEFRSDDKEKTLAGIYEMTRQRFKAARYLLTAKEWDFFMMVEMGTDRIHHAFWRYFDREHRLYEKGTPFENAVLDYYKYIDEEIGSILEILDRNTTVMLVSDHGAKRMDGGICVNEWLIREGYLCLEEMPATVTPIARTKIDWSKTLAWGEGGYYSRVFLNVKGREPHGVIEPEDYERTRDEIKARIESLGNERGEQIGTVAYKPESIYRQCNGIPPDLIVIFGDLYWRAVGSVGHETIHVFENDTGPDDANHARKGIIVMSNLDGSGSKGMKMDNLQILDVAPTILDLLGMTKIPHLCGKVIRSADNVYDAQEEEKIRSRLEALGYIE